MFSIFKKKTSVQGTDSEIDEKITVKAKDKVVVSTEDEEVTTIVSSTKSTQVTNDSPWQDPTGSLPCRYDG